MTVVSVIFCTLSNEGFNPSAQPLRLIGAKKRDQISSDSNKSFDRYRSLFLCFFHLIVFCDGSILLLLFSTPSFCAQIARCFLFVIVLLVEYHQQSLW